MARTRVNRDHISRQSPQRYGSHTSNRQHGSHLYGGESTWLAGHDTATTMLWVGAHIRQASGGKEEPGLYGSRQERIIGDSQSAQKGRSLEALPWKNEGTERLSITRFPWLGGSATHSQSPIDAGTGR